MNFFLLGLGSNIQPEQNLPKAQSALEEVGQIATCSPALSTQAVGKSFHQSFHNQLLVFESELPAPLLKQKLQQIEVALGREPKSPARKTKDRTIDIDILGQGNSQQDCLTMPLDEIYYQKVQQAWQQNVVQFEKV